MADQTTTTRRPSNKGKSQKKPQLKAVAQTPEVVEETVEEDKGPGIIRRSFTKTGHGLHVAGVAVADFSLRDLGQGAKRATAKLPKVRIERSESTTED